MAAKIFKVVTSLEEKCKAFGGKTIRDCLTDANTQLGSLETRLLEEVSRRVGEVRRLTPLCGDAPDKSLLLDIHRLSDEALGYCVGIRRPGLVECLQMLCELADMALEGNSAAVRAFGPAQATAAICLGGALARTEVDRLVGELRHRVDLLSARTGTPAPARRA